MSILTKTAGSKSARLGVALGLTGAALVGMVSTQTASAATVSLKLQSATGANTGATIAVAGSGFTDAAGASLVYNNASGIQFNSATACPAAPATAAAGSVYDVSTKAVVSATKLVVTAPSMTLGASSAPKTYLLCVYKNATTLLGQGKYTVYAAPTVTGVTPASGSVAGGNSVVISGTGFTNKSVVKFGSFVASKITVAKTNDSITAVVPSQAAGAVDVTVTTEGGANANTSADDYTYRNAVVVTPQTGVVAGGTSMTVTGVGFNALKTGFAAGTPTADVVFSVGAFNPTPNSTPAPTNPAVAHCGNVQVVSDTELVCTTPALTGALANGAALTVQVVSDPGYTWAKAQASGAGYTAATSGGFQTVVSSGATYTFAGF